MDVIEKIIAGHRVVFEKRNMLTDLVKMLDNDPFFWDKAEDITRFFKKEIREHIAMEEKILFPVFKKSLSGAELDILIEIETEHKPIINRLDGFNVIAENHRLYPSKATREHMVESACGIIETISSHAQKEDEKLFPYIKESFREEHLRELEDLYFRFMKI